MDGDIDFGLPFRCRGESVLEEEENDVVVVGSLTWSLTWSWPLDPGGGEAVASAVDVEGWAKTNEARETSGGGAVVVSWRGKKMRKSRSL